MINEMSYACRSFGATAHFGFAGPTLDCIAKGFLSADFRRLAESRETSRRFFSA